MSKAVTNTNSNISCNRTVEAAGRLSHYTGSMQIHGQNVSNLTSNISNLYHCHGKELQNQTNYYDYGFRQYDPQLGRWHVIDAMAEKYFSQSPYNYVGNNPVSSADFMGLTYQSVWDIIKVLLDKTPENGVGNWTSGGGFSYFDSVGNALDHNVSLPNLFGGILIRHKDETVLYRDGKLTWLDGKRDGQPYDGKNFNSKKGIYTGYIGNVFNALQDIKNGGPIGLMLINELENNSTFVIIEKPIFGKGNKYTGYVYWSPMNRYFGGLDENGSRKSERYIGLAHELAHAYDERIDGKIDRSTWYYQDLKPIHECEKFATHIENMIRAENGLPLREFYGIHNGQGTGRLIYEGTRQSVFMTNFNYFRGEFWNYPWTY